MTIMDTICEESQLSFRFVAKLNGRRSVQKPPQMRTKPMTRSVSF
jgi:hypothetical protein